MRRSGFRFDSPWGEAALLLLAPIVCVVAFHISLINQVGFIDPWYYTGYGRVFPALFQVHGWPYYAVRYPVIMANELFTTVFGPAPGFIVLRYVITVGCGGVVYLWARRSFGRAAAVFGYLFLFCSPYLARVITWDLTTFLSVPLATAGIAAYLMPTARPWPWRILAGLLFGLSVASHAFTASAIGIFLILEFVAKGLARRRELIRLDAPALAVGGVMSLLIGIAFYYLSIGPFDPTKLFTVTFDALRAGNQYSATHASVLTAWIGKALWLYPVVVLTLSCAFMLKQQLLREDMAARVTRFAIAYIAFYLYYQVLAGSFVIETFYYFAHLTVAFYLLAPAWYALATRDGRLDRRAAIALFAVLIAVPLLQQWDPTAGAAVEALVTNKFVVLGALLAGWLMIAAAMAALNVPPAKAVLAAVFLLLLQAISFAPSVHRALYGKPLMAEAPFLKAGSDLAEVWAHYAGPKTHMVLWYPQTDAPMASVASTILLDTVQNQWIATGGPPEITSLELGRLEVPTVRYVMVIGDQRRAAAALANLRANGFGARAVQTSEMGDKTWHRHGTVIELTSKPANAPTPAG